MNPKYLYIHEIWPGGIASTEKTHLWKNEIVRKSELTREKLRFIWEVRDVKLDTLRAKREPLRRELKEIEDILRKNKLLVDYISGLKLIVKSSTGEEILVTKETLVGFMDNIELLVTRREMLAKRLGEVNQKISSLEKQRDEEDQLFKVQTVIEAFDSDIRKINIDPIATQNIIEQLKSHQKNLQEHIRSITKQDNDAVVELHKSISRYACELGVSETYVAPNKDYIFTSDLKSLSGTILHKIVFAFKLAYIKLIREKADIVLPIVLDSPSGREVEYNTVETMLKIIQRDYPQHQLIVASIHNYDLENKKIIELKDRLFNMTDIISVS